MRDLEKVWAAPGPARGFGPTNTVMIDDTARKMREHPHNVVVVPSFDERDVVRDKDDVLEFLLAYLDMVLEEPGDVRETIGDKPFRHLAFDFEERAAGDD